MRTSALVALLVAAVVTPWPRAAVADTRPAEPLIVLDVPFLPQSDFLCGGAAAAMVLRYWGAREIFAEDFAALVDVRVSGIRGSALEDAIRSRGWTVQSFRGEERIAKEYLRRGRPLIALIEDQPGRYHYVVLIAWPEGYVIVHDPARAPFRVLTDSAFSTAWAATGFWTLLILPNPQTSSGDWERLSSRFEAPEPESPADDCDALIQEGVRLAQAGDHDSANAALSTAVARCPTSAGARELAGLRFLESRWHEAAQLAALAVARAPNDTQAWRLLASSRFVQDDLDGALSAWNQVGEPRVDVVRVEGLSHTSYAHVARLLDFAPGSLLTPQTLRHARRRLALSPVGSASRVGYSPIAGGFTDIDAAIVEPPRFFDRAALGALAAHALTERELHVDVTVPSYAGARWIGDWRWWDERPRIGLALMTPVAFGRSGLWRIEGFWERQPYAVSDGSDGGAIVRNDRTRLALSYTDWATADTRGALGVAFDRWNQSPWQIAIFGSIERRFAADHVAARVRGAAWPALSIVTGFGTGGCDLSWRSSTSEERAVLMVRGGVESASARAPFDVWPGADVGHARDVLARAHPLLTDGVVRGGIFGRALAHGGAEWQKTTLARGPARIAIAAFGDVARAWHPLDVTAETRTQIDVGIGLRLRVAGQAPALRVDVAHGLRDGNTAISAGWQLPWPAER
jgi:hypothetical protein